MKTFKQPLTAKEEAVYLNMMETGSETERAQAKETLIEHNLRLVAHIAKKYQNVDEETEDMISIGTIGLIKAIDSFDSGKGKLSTSAHCGTGPFPAGAGGCGREAGGGEQIEQAARPDP